MLSAFVGVLRTVHIKTITFLHFLLLLYLSEIVKFESIRFCPLPNLVLLFYYSKSQTQTTEKKSLHFSLLPPSVKPPQWHGHNFLQQD